MKNELRITAPETEFRLSLEHEMRFTTKCGKLHGGPVPGIEAGDRGILPEPYHAAAGEAVYAVYYYETPILWRASDGKWYVPMHSYSKTTSRHRDKMVRALALSGIEVEKI